MNIDIYKDGYWYKNGPDDNADVEDTLGVTIGTRNTLVYVDAELVYGMFIRTGFVHIDKYHNDRHCLKSKVCWPIIHHLCNYEEIFFT